MRRFVATAATALIFLVSGCAAEAPSYPEPSTGSTHTAAPTPTFDTEAPTPSQTEIGETAVSPREIAEACVVASRALGDALVNAEQRSNIRIDDARTALRPDGNWYVVVPYDDPESAYPVEYQCELTPNLSTALSSGARVIPEEDDFDDWATGNETRDGI